MLGWANLLAGIMVGIVNQNQGHSMNKDKEYIEHLTKQLTSCTQARNQLREQSTNKEEMIRQLQEQLKLVTAERDELRRHVNAF